MISLFENLDIHFIEIFIDTYLNKNDIEELGKLFIQNKFLSNFLRNIENIWKNKLYNIEINYRFTLTKHPRFDSINYHHYLKNNDNQYLSIILQSIIKLNNDQFNNNDLYPGYRRSCYSFCDNIYYASSFSTEMLLKIYKKINVKEYKNILEIFRYCKKYNDKTIFIYNSDYISLNTIITGETKIIDQDNNIVNFLNIMQKIKYINNIYNADYYMKPYIFDCRALYGLYILKFYIDTVYIK